MNNFLILILIFAHTFIFSGKALPQEETVDEEVGQTIIDVLNSVLPPNPDRVIEPDYKTGKLVIHDTPSNHKIIRDIIKTLDEEPAQIEIETRFVELKLTDSDEFGFSWGNTFMWYGWGPSPDISPTPVTADGIETVPGRKIPKWRFSGQETDGSFGNVITFTPATSGGLDLSIAKLNTNQLDFFLHALEKSDKANLLSSPRITTISGQMANIQISQTTPYVEDDDVTIEEFKYWEYDPATGLYNELTREVERHSLTMNQLDLGIKLEVTPTVGEAGIITLILRPEVEVLTDRITIFAGSTVDDLGWPVVDIRACDTTVRIKNGETVVLGGLMDDDHKVYDKKVPVLGDIPLLGNLFRSKYTARIKKNLLIFVTATLINPSGEVVKAGY